MEYLPAEAQGLSNSSPWPFQRPLHFSSRALHSVKMATDYPAITTGRGGAGNVYTSADIQDLQTRSTEVLVPRVRIPVELSIQRPSNSSVALQDVEAQNQSPSAAAAPPSQDIHPLSDYLHSGRGGAGNWYPTAETGTAPSASASVLDSTADPATATTATIGANGQAPIRTTATTTTYSIDKDGKRIKTVGYKVVVGNRTASGRGGVGNIYEARAIEERRRKQLEMEAEQKREAVRKQVEKDVEVLVGAPPRAFLGGRRSDEDGVA